MPNPADRACGAASVLAEYRGFLAEVDRLCSRLVQTHAPYLRCRRGCCECCTDISVLPIEAESLRERLSRAHGQTDAPERRSGACPLLRNGACSVYADRPLICRTHGLPLLYPVTVYDETGLPVDEEDPERLLTWCELNFRGLSRKRIDRFPGEGLALDMRELNLRLEGFNARYLATAAGRRFRPGRRISVREIVRGERPGP